MTATTNDIKALYASYRKTSDEEIRKLLGRILIVRSTHKGNGSVFGLYTMDSSTMAEILERPRNVSHTWDHKPEKLVEGLREFKRIPFLVKSSSCFFLKPDIGEVFDAMSEEDKERTKAIESLTDSVEVSGPGSSGDHFLCTAILYE